MAGSINELLLEYRDDPNTRHAVSFHPGRTNRTHFPCFILVEMSHLVLILLDPISQSWLASSAELDFSRLV
jgi:hypothetical protein